MERDLKNKIVVVTGAADGIGFSIARMFIKGGAKIAILLDVNENKGIKAVSEITSEFGKDKAVFFKCDVTKDLDTIFEKVIAEYGQVDVLVNNAGIGDDNDPQKIIDVNLTAVTKWSMKFHDHMRVDKNGNGGTVINISSILGLYVIPYKPLYIATKFGVIGYSKSLGHKDIYDKSGVRVVVVCPGFTKTSMVTDIIENKLDEDFLTIIQNVVWQSTEEVGAGTVEVFEKSDSGTVWTIIGGAVTHSI